MKWRRAGTAGGENPSSGSGRPGSGAAVPSRARPGPAADDRPGIGKFQQPGPRGLVADSGFPGQHLARQSGSGIGGQGGQQDLAEFCGRASFAGRARFRRRLLEVFSAMILSYTSPFANQIVPSIPEAYKQLNVLQNFSNIYNAISGVQVPVMPIGFYSLPDGTGLGMYTPNADDGSGIFPGSVNLANLVQEDSLNNEGSATSTITQPPVATEKTSFDGIKAMFRDATR